jgi:hypothetical protein
MRRGGRGRGMHCRRGFGVGNVDSLNGEVDEAVGMGCGEREGFTGASDSEGGDRKGGRRGGLRTWIATSVGRRTKTGCL